MKVQFADIPNNWKLWGALVFKWISDPRSWPNDTNQLLGQMTGITGITKPVHQTPAQPLHITQDDDTAIQFLLPSKAAVDAGSNDLKDNQPYPLGSFYDTAFAAVPPAHRPPLPIGSSKDFALKRIGEYTILECQ